MFNPNNHSRAAELFAHYRNENNFLLAKFKNIKTLLDRLNKLGEVERKDVISSSIFSMQSSKLGNLYDGIHLNLSRILEIISKLIECLEKEKKELDEYMGKLKNPTIDSHNRLEQLLVTYNKEQYDYMQQLNAIIPGIVEQFDLAIGMEDKTIADTAKGLKRKYDALEEALKNSKINKDSLYLLLEDVIFALRDHSKNLGDIKKKYKESDNFYIFVSHFAVHNRVILRELNKMRSACERDKDKDKLYTEVAKEKVNDVHKNMRDFLHALFEGIEIGVEENKKKEAKDLIDKIIDVKLDFAELKDKWDKGDNSLKKRLQQGIANSKFDYTARKGFGDLEVQKIDGTKISLKTFESLFNDKDNKNDVDHILYNLDVIMSKSEYWKQSVFKKFLEKQSILEKDDSKDSEKENVIRDALNQIVRILSTEIGTKGIVFDKIDNIQEDNFININESSIVQLLSHLFDEVKKENDLYVSKRFKAILKEKNIENADDEKIQELLKMVYNKRSLNDLESFKRFFTLLFDIIKYKDLIS